MLAVIFVIHDRPWRTVNNISQLLLCHAAGFSCPLDCEPYIVQELDRKVTMAEQIATMRYRMNAFMFWYIFFSAPPILIYEETDKPVWQTIYRLRATNNLYNIR